MVSMRVKCWLGNIFWPGKQITCFLTIVICFILVEKLPGQTYFKSIGTAASSYNMKVLHFPNGDILLGDSDLQGLGDNESGKVILTRLDNCGNLVWSNSYEREDEYLEFKDFAIDHENQIYVFGSAFRGFDELVFLLKVSGDGTLVKFSLFETETVDRFSYSIDLTDDRLMVYGLLLDFNTKKEGFVALFDLGFNFQWGRKFTPFESTGDATFSKDRGTMCWSGSFFYKLDQNGEIEWALDGSVEGESILTLSGPVELEGGHVFQGYQNDASFFYMINNEGVLQWQSASIPSKKQAAHLLPLSNNQIMVTYTATDGNEQKLCRLLLDHHGQISDQQRLSVAAKYQPESISQSIGFGHHVILVNGVLRPDYSLDVEDFLLQFETDMPHTNCLDWEPISDQIRTSYTLNFNAIDTPAVSTLLTLESATKTGVNSWQMAGFTDQCDESLEPSITSFDSLIPCGETWEVVLPSADFQWVDMPDAPPVRILDQTGVYEASNRDCIDPMVYEYTMTQPDCECNLYLANAFTPNNDGINDFLSLQGTCHLTGARILIFDRWGNTVFESTNPETAWSGDFKGQKLPSGVYVAQISYTKANQSGALEEGKIMQDVLLIR